MGLKSNNIPNKNRISDSGPAQRPAPTGLSLSDIIYRFKSLTTKHYIDGVKNNNLSVIIGSFKSVASKQINQLNNVSFKWR